MFGAVVTAMGTIRQKEAAEQLTINRLFRRANDHLCVLVMLAFCSIFWLPFVLIDAALKDSCSYGHFGTKGIMFESTCIFAVHQQRSWADAMKMCQRLSTVVSSLTLEARLLSLESSEKWQFLVRTFDDMQDKTVDGKFKGDWWIGAKKVEAPYDMSSFRWFTDDKTSGCSLTQLVHEDGSKLLFETDEAHSCVRIEADKSPMRLLDKDCKERHKYFCQIEEAVKCSGGEKRIDNICYIHGNGKKATFEEAFAECLKKQAILGGPVSECSLPKFIQWLGGPNTYWVNLANGAGARMMLLDKAGCTWLPNDIRDAAYSGDYPYVLKADNGALIHKDPNEKHKFLCMKSRCGTPDQYGPCLNLGICYKDSAGGKRCGCRKGYYGGVCEHHGEMAATSAGLCQASKCSPNPCGNGGTCTETTSGTGFKCQCATGFRGSKCEQTDPCVAATPICKNGGTCKSKGNLATCECATGFEGDKCQNVINHCNPNPCAHGACTNEPDGWTCTCQRTFKGDRCQNAVECTADLCQNGGTCKEKQPTGYKCKCATGFSGDHCETKPVDKCNPNPCNPAAGTCNAATGKCNCLFGFTGPTCSKAPGASGAKTSGKTSKKTSNKCDSDPCQNGGSCTNKGYKFVCDCTTGWSGIQCERDFDECESSPCLNKGTCTDQFSGYNCSCLASFTGTICETPLTSCDLQEQAEMNRRVAMMTSWSLSSVNLLVMLGILMVVFLVLLDFTTERILHFGQELSLFVAHLVVLFARTPTVLDSAALCDEEATGNPPKFGEDTCRMIAATLHYLFFVHFAFLFVEALHNYSTFTYMVVNKPLFNKFGIVFLGILLPLIPVGLTIAFHFKTYTHEKTCWLNFSGPNFYYVVFPIIPIAVLALIISEASGKEYPEITDADHHKRVSAFANSRSACFLIPLSLGAWLVGMLAVDEVDLSLYSIASISNTVLGVLLLLSHTLGNRRARAMLVKIFCCCCKKNDDPALKYTDLD